MTDEQLGQLRSQLTDLQHLRLAYNDARNVAAIVQRLIETLIEDEKDHEQAA